ncbi:MAG TPA: serine hydrolase [Planctomycetaceae bacterium]|nr:serine hydrolase [Planctomycetaceae bacterium]
MGVGLLVAALLVVGLTPAAARAQALTQTRPESVGLSSERLARLGRQLDEYAEKRQLAGGVALVARKGQVAYVKAFGQRDIEAGAPMREDSIFRIASQSKAVISVAAMILQEEGKLLTTDPVGKYIPEFAETTVAVPKEGGGYDVVKAKRPVNIRDLLTHTSGVSYGGGIAKDKWEEARITGYYFADRDEPIAATVARMGKLPFDAHPGEAYIYGYNTDILGVVVEKASGKPLDQFLQTALFEPLGMTDTHFYLPPNKSDRLAVVYAPTGPTGLKKSPDGGSDGQGAYVSGPRKSFSGGAGLLSTARDYGRFLQMMLNGGELDGHRILSRKTVELMTVNHLANVKFPWTTGVGFGLGFSVLQDVGARGTPGSVGEYGWGGAYHSTYWVDPREELVVVYFTQLIPAGGIDDHGKLRTLIYQAIID